MLTFSLTLLPKIVSFLFLAAITALYLKRKSLPSVLIRLGITVAVIFFAYLGFSKTLFTYVVWSQDGFSKHFLPPYTPISYFADYSFFRFWLGYIIAAAMALLIFGFLIFLKKKRPVLLDKEDASLAAFGALISGWPGLLVYFPLALLLMVFWHIFLAAKEKFSNGIILSDDKELRVPITPFIFIAAFITLLFSSYILKYLGLEVLIPAKSAL